MKPVWCALLLASGLVACGGRGKGAVNTAAAEQPMAQVAGNPFLGVELFRPDYTNSDQARRRLQKTNPQEAALIAKIADVPQARWLGEWSGEIETVSRNYVKAATRAGKVSLLVAYNLPYRDCGQYSAGGASRGAKYKEWIDALGRGIGPSHRAIVVLEPDALGHLEDECLSAEAKAERLQLLRYAVDELEALPGVSVYLDAGHPRWANADVMAERLRQAGVERARGFAINVSNYVATNECLEYGKRIVAALGSDVHFVVDTSRNGNGPPDAEGEAAWCNPTGRALGERPTTETGDPAADAFVWIKNPGESDGTCSGGPEAGQWFEERALELARNASW
jgi:endoglucanase